MLIKVCGLRDSENVKAVDALGVDLTGFVFVAQSPRYVEMINSGAGTMPDYSETRLNEAQKATEPQTDGCVTERCAGGPKEDNRTEGQNIQKHPLRVGVFVDDMPQNIITRIYNFALDAVQLHGNESPVMIENLRRSVSDAIAPTLKIIKAVSINSAEDFDRCAQYESMIDMLLFDTKCETGGGSGQHFDWTLLDHYHGATPFLLSGGIGPDDVDSIKQIKHPMFAGVDLNSRFETAPGVKDIEKLRLFIERVNA